MVRVEERHQGFCLHAVANRANNAAVSPQSRQNLPQDGFLRCTPSHPRPPRCARGGLCEPAVFTRAQWEGRPAHSPRNYRRVFVDPAFHLCSGGQLHGVAVLVDGACLAAFDVG